MTLLQLQDAPLAPPATSKIRIKPLSPPVAEPVLAITGMAAEARLAAGPGVTTVMAAGSPARLRSLLGARGRPDCRAVISIGIAGGLDPMLVPGDVIVATGVAAPDRRHAAAPSLVQHLATRLAGHPKRVIMADVAGVECAVMSASGKRALHYATGALVVDMESHVAAAYAAHHRLPFAAVRVVCDPAHRTLPDLAASAVNSDGRVSLGNVMRSLWRQPVQLFTIPGLARDAAEGFRALKRCRDLLGHGFGLHDQDDCEEREIAIVTG